MEAGSRSDTRIVRPVGDGLHQELGSRLGPLALGDLIFRFLISQFNLFDHQSDPEIGDLILDAFKCEERAVYPIEISREYRSRDT